jgi:hypothetical protein
MAPGFHIAWNCCCYPFKDISLTPYHTMFFRSYSCLHTHIHTHTHIKHTHKTQTPLQVRYYGPQGPGASQGLHPGDVIASNHPQLAGGSHLPDITVTSPVFQDGQLAFFVASRGHHTDIGVCVCVCFVRVCDDDEALRVYFRGTCLTSLALCVNDQNYLVLLSIRCQTSVHVWHAGYLCAVGVWNVASIALPTDL